MYLRRFLKKIDVSIRDESFLNEPFFVPAHRDELFLLKDINDSVRQNKYVFLTNLSGIISNVQFISNHDDGNSRAGFGLVNLIPDHPDFFKGSHICHIVHQDEGISRGDGQSAHGREFEGSRSVEDVQGELDPLDGEVSVVHLLHCSLVLGGEGVVEEAGYDGGLADLGGPHHDYLVPDVVG